MESLPEDHNYTLVLTYMQQANEDSFERAAEALQRHRYDLTAALDDHHAAMAQLQAENEAQLQADNEAQQADHQGLLHADHEALLAGEQMVEEEAVQRYLEFVAEKRRRRMGVFGLLLHGIKYILGALARGVARVVLPQWLLLRLFYPRFQSLYFRRLALPAQRAPLRELLMATRNLRRKSVLLAVSGEEVDGELVRLLNAPPIAEAVAMWFSFAGCTVGDSQLALIPRPPTSTEILVCRMDAFEQVVVVSRIEAAEFAGLDSGRLRESYEAGVRQMERDRAIVRTCKAYQLLLEGVRRGTISESEAEEEHYRPPQQSKEIADQNAAYRALEQRQMELSRLRGQEEERGREEEARAAEEAELRKIRLESIPAEPLEGAFVRINFRCPDGSSLSRNFAAHEQVELLYTWVDVNPAIEFEGEGRAFELMHSYPLRGLTPDRNRTLAEVFPEEQERVVIREL